MTRSVSTQVLAGGWLGRPLVVAAAPVLVAAAALLVTAPAAPLRTLTGLFFLVVLVPALQALAGAFAGWGGAIAVGLVAAALTVWQVALPPRPMEAQPVQWTTAFTAPDQEYRAAMQPPPKSRAAEALRRGGQALVGICLSRGAGGDLDVRLDGRPLTVLRPPAPSYCWLELDVPRGAVPDPPKPVEVSLRPKAGTLPPSGERTNVIGGYTRPPERGGRSGGVVFFDGQRSRSDDLSPLDEGQQQGRLFVELRILDAAGRVVEVWY